MPAHYRIVDVSTRMELLGIEHRALLGQARAQWVAESLHIRDSKATRPSPVRQFPRQVAANLSATQGNLMDVKGKDELRPRAPDKHQAL